MTSAMPPWSNEEGVDRMSEAEEIRIRKIYADFVRRYITEIIAVCAEGNPVAVNQAITDLTYELFKIHLYLTKE